MKRSGPIPRKTPLKGSGLSRKARAPIARKPLLAKPKPVTPEEREARRIVAERSGGLCEACAGNTPATDWSHRIARSQGGPWDAANGIAMCRTHHAQAHANPEAARRLGWMVRRGHDYQSTPAFLVRHGGHVLLDPAGGVTPTELRPAA